VKDGVYTTNAAGRGCTEIFWGVQGSRMLKKIKVFQKKSKKPRGALVFLIFVETPQEFTSANQR
jgi:hypothetical protein